MKEKVEVVFVPLTDRIAAITEEWHMYNKGEKIELY